MSWWIWAILSAVAAAATAILGKVGVRGVPSNLATAIRTVVVLVFAWGIVLARGETRGLSSIGWRTLTFLGLSGLATGVSWLCYYRALSLAPASRVAPIDKLSLALTVLLAALFLHEPVTPKLWLSTGLIVAGALLAI